MAPLVSYGSYILLQYLDQNVRDVELEALLGEDSCQTPQVVPITLRTTQQAVLHRLKLIQREPNHYWGSLQNN